MSVIILPETTKNPISLIGERAGICWGADTTDKAKNYKRGLDCIKANHGRTLEYVNVEMVLDGYSARVIREWYTHIGGAPTRLQESTRYIDYGEFEYVTPPSIAKNEDALAYYEYTMENISSGLSYLEELGIPREDIAMLLPLGMKTKIVDKRNLRNLIDMSRQRMCTRAYWEYRQLFKDICDALKEYSEEWAYIIDTQMMPKCEALGYCPETKGCGRMQKKVDQKEEFVERLQETAGSSWYEIGREIAERWLNDE
jgi:thymidylate synthase (FAD)